LLHVGEQPFGFGAGLLAAAAHSQVFLAEFFELRMNRVQAAQIGVRLGGGGDAIEDRRRLEELRAAVEIGINCRKIDDAPATGITLISDRHKFDLGGGDGFGVDLCRPPWSSPAGWEIARRAPSRRA
jgi:hypothetical protein